MGGGKPTNLKTVLRCDEAAYKFYLSKMIDLIHDNNSSVIIMTAPWEPRLMRGDIGWLKQSTLESFYLHPCYVDLTRQVSVNKNIRLLDLYSIFELQKNDKPHEFFSDPFHYNKTGAFMVAMELSKVIKGIFEE